MDLPFNPTKQNVLDHIVVSMRKQGKLSIREEVTTRKITLYYNPNGCKCPIGHLMPERSYNTMFERGSISSLASRGLLVHDNAWMAKPEMISFLNGIQKCHDDALVKTIGDFESALGKLAVRYNLAYPKA